MFKKVLFPGIILFFSLRAFGQNSREIIQQSDVAFIENTLAADSMMGRKIFTPGIEKASRFIASQFKVIGLDTLDGENGYRQEFSSASIKHAITELKTDGKKLPDSSVIIISTELRLHWTEKDNIKRVIIGPDDNLMQRMRENLRPQQNTVVWIDPVFKQNFARIRDYLQEEKMDKEMPYSAVFILHSGSPDHFDIQSESHKKIRHANNVVGVLPGKSRPQEYVVFSAHYDHLGIGKPQRGDSIYNGANDDASGTAAVIELAKYFKAKNDNNRTLIFVAFTGEEEGGYGSRYFSEQMDPSKVVAMFNIEMIGTESKWGKNSAYITGYEKTDFGKILQSNLQKTGFSFYPDPYPAQNLFYRSDNATLARQGVAAHTISTSKMDEEPNYHRVTDEVSTLDLENMTAIIQAIAISSASIISGLDTPTRVDTTGLKN